jgi:hypothetical protein
MTVPSLPTDVTLWHRRNPGKGTDAMSAGGGVAHARLCGNPERTKWAWSNVPGGPSTGIPVTALGRCNPSHRLLSPRISLSGNERL